MASSFFRDVTKNFLSRVASASGQRAQARSDGHRDNQSGVERPVFVFSSGWRTGSTLLQRLLCSAPDVLIWGENRGMFSCFEQAAQIMDGLECLSQKHVEEFQSRGSMGWIAVMNPPIEDFRNGLRRLLEIYYRDPASRLGRDRWGFKEVRHGLETARFLTQLYPEARFILLVRHPEDCLASARATSPFGLAKGLLDEVGGPERFLELWAERAAEFLEGWGDIHHTTLRYEDLVARPQEAIAKVARLLDIPAASFNLRTFDVRRRGWLELPPRLTREDEQALRADSLGRVADRWTYVPHQKP